MDNYLIDRETLGKFIDGLIKQKPLPVDTVEELNDKREEAIKNLDDRIGIAIFSQLTKAQYAELNQLLNDNQSTEETFTAFFNRAGLNLEQIITDTIKSFSAEFLGGQNV